MDGGVVDDVEVIERHHRRLRGGVEVVDETHQHGFGRDAAVLFQHRQRVHTEVRVGGLQCGDQMNQEPAQVGVVGFQGQPRHARGPVGRVWHVRCEPLRQDGGLAESGWCRDEDESGHRARLDHEAGP